MKHSCLIFFFQKQNKYSINALIGALESKDYLKKIDIFLCQEELPEFILSLKKKYKKIGVAFTFFTSQIFLISSLVRHIRQKFPDIILIAGGPHVSGQPKKILNLGFHVAVRGEGEDVILELVDWLLEEKSIKNIKGIYYREGKKNIFTGRKEFIDLDRYHPFSIEFKKFGPIEITRGCPFGCFFCQTSYIFGKKPRHRAIETILTYVEIMYQRGIKDIRFITPNAFSYGSEDGKTLNYDKIESLLKGIRKIIKNKGRIFFGSFPSEVRPEHVNKDTVNLVKQFADNDNLVIGCQSGSERMLELCKRGHTVLDVYRAVDICVKNNLTPKIDFIFGLPGEEFQDIKESIKVMKDLIKKGAKIHAHTFIPLPGTPFSKKQPENIEPYLNDFVRYALPRGFVFGDFLKQKKLAEQLRNFGR